MCRESLTQRVNPLGPVTFLNIRATGWREFNVGSLPYLFSSSCGIYHRAAVILLPETG